MENFPSLSIAVQAALRGDEEAPPSVPGSSRLESISIPPISERAPPPIPSTPRPPVPSHGQQSTPPTANGRHGSVHSSRSRGQEPLPPPPRQQPQLPPIPPLPNRSGSGALGSPSSRAKRESPPPVSSRGTSPPQQPNPPLPNRGSLPARPSAKVPPPKKAPPHKRTSSSSLRGHPDVPDRPQPPSRLRNGSEGGSALHPMRNTSGPGLPPRQPSRTGPPTPNKPAPGGNRPKPPPPARPIKKPGFVSPPLSGAKEDAPVNIPTGEGMSAREMADSIDREVPNVLRLMTERDSSVPQLLETLATLVENFADNARGTGVQFRITMSSLRSQVGTLQDNANAVWQTNSETVAEALKNIQQQVKNMSKNLVN